MNYQLEKELSQCSLILMGHYSSPIWKVSAKRHTQAVGLQLAGPPVTTQAQSTSSSSGETKSVIVPNPYNVFCKLSNGAGTNMVRKARESDHFALHISRRSGRTAKNSWRKLAPNSNSSDGSLGQERQRRFRGIGRDHEKPCDF
jgi:hypothetical protein